MTTQQMKEIAESHGFKAKTFQSIVVIEIPCVSRNGTHYIERMVARDVPSLRKALGY